MTSQREILSKRLRDIMDGRPVRWAEARNLIGDYDGLVKDWLAAVGTTAKAEYEQAYTAAQSKS